MLKVIKGLVMACVVVVLAACSDVSTYESQTAYVYNTDIDKSERYNGSDYFMHHMFEAKYKQLVIDYGLESRPFKATYTLPAEQKISIDVEAEIIYSLLRNPLDKGDLQYADDEYVQFYAESVTPLQVKQDEIDIQLIDGKMLYNKLMVETEDLAFRSVFTDVGTYPTFDILESNIISIQEDIKKRLEQVAKENKIRVVAVRIKDIIVPDPIKESRLESLKIEQKAINDKQRIEHNTKLMAKQMAYDVRKALNELEVDKITGNVSRSYLLIKTIRDGLESGADIDLSLSPSLMEYLEKSGTTQSSKVDDDYIDKLNRMSDKELLEHFQR